MVRQVIPIILSGGSGRRLWPLSQPEHPKQFLRLVTEKSLLQDTVLRTRGLKHRASGPIVVCNEAHRFLVAEQLRELGVTPEAIVLEPAGRNTAPAVAIAALLARGRAAAGEDPILLVLPADHVIKAREAFVNAAEAAIEAALDGNLVTFGIVPDRPETGYGYIRLGAKRSKWSAVESFVEKPSRDKAERYVASGRYLWNSGMFVFTAKNYLRELGRHAEGMIPACEAALGGASVDEDFMRLGDAFLDCPSDSIDYAVMEKTDRAAVVTLEAGWSDIGSWAALHEILPKDAGGNVVRGEVLLEDCRDCHVEASNRLVAVVGLEGVVVVETAAAVLVVDGGQSQAVKAVAEAAGRRGGGTGDAERA